MSMNTQQEPSIETPASPIAQHSSESNEHFTPTDITDAARAVMGAIDLDPATTELVNRERIRAHRFLTREDDGLSTTWSGRVFLNPPGGKLVIDKETGRWREIEKGPGASSAAVWWDKLAFEYTEGRVKEAIFLGFTLEILMRSQSASVWMGVLPFCIPKQRIKFDLLADDGKSFKRSKQPTHSNIIAYMPPVEQRANKIEAFLEAFARFGRATRNSFMLVHK